MKRRHREINIFNLSMLDVISGAMAAFLIIMVVLLPYYKKEHVDYQAVIADLRETMAVAERRARTAEGEVAAAAARAAEADAAAEAAASRARTAEREADALRPRDLELMIVLDTTGSMSEQIESLQSDLKGLVRILQEISKELRVGLIAYRDRGDEEDYLTRDLNLTVMDDSGLRRLERFVDELAAGGGGDGPEAVDAGLEKAIAQRWNPDAAGIIVVIGDAPPHDHAVDVTYRMAQDFAARSSRYRVSTISAPRVAEGYFEALASRGNGVYITGATALLESILVSVLHDDDPS